MIATTQGRLLKTMRFVEALPPFGTKQWRMLVILLLDALSIHRLPRLGVHFSNNRTMLRQVLFDHFFFATPQKSVEIAGLKTSRMPAAAEGFPFRCLNVTLIIFLYRCWKLLEQVKQSMMCFVMWYSLWVARRHLHLAAVADLLYRSWEISHQENIITM